MYAEVARGGLCRQLLKGTRKLGKLEKLEPYSSSNHTIVSHIWSCAVLLVVGHVFFRAQLLAFATLTGAVRFEKGGSILACDLLCHALACHALAPIPCLRQVCPKRE
eukprot:5496005-Amphidinium_carterae.1